jgi:transposase
VPKPFPKEFREDVVRVARDRGPGVSIEQVAKDFGIHQTTLHSWLRAADVEERPRSTASPDVLAENRDLKRRNRLLEQENEVLRRAAAYLAQGSLPGKGSTRS